MMGDKRINVWVSNFADRTNLILQWYDPVTRRRKSRSAETADETKAERARADLEYELNHGGHRESSRMSWPAFRKIFEEEYVAARRERTRESYRSTFACFERICNPKLLRGITERTVSQFAAALRQERGKAKGSTGQMPATINLKLALLKTALRWAVKQKLITEVPNFPTIKIPRKRPQPIPAESFERLYDQAADDNMRAFLLAGWLAGLRLSEAAALEWETTGAAPYLDLARNRILFPAEFVKAVEDQWVPLDPVLKEALLKLPQRGRRVFYFESVHGRRLRGNGICQRIKSLAKRAGVKLTMHSLRKGFGCRYAGRVPAQVLQRLMRHSDIKITLGYYANVDEAVMEAVLGGNGHSCGNSGRGSAAGRAGYADASQRKEQG
jgi:integrase